MDDRIKENIKILTMDLYDYSAAALTDNRVERRFGYVLQYLSISN